MPKSERSPSPSDVIVEEAAHARADKKLGRAPKVDKARETALKLEALEALIAERYGETDPNKRDMLKARIDADVAFLAENMPEAFEDNTEMRIKDLQGDVKKARGKKQKELIKRLKVTEEVLERIRGQRLVEIPETPSQEATRREPDHKLVGEIQGRIDNLRSERPKLKKAADHKKIDQELTDLRRQVQRAQNVDDPELFAADWAIAEEQRQALEDIDLVMAKTVAGPKLEVAETRALNKLRNRLTKLRTAYDHGDILPKDFATDATILLSDIQEHSDVLQSTIATREEGRKEVPVILRETREAQDELGAEGMIEMAKTAEREREIARRAELPESEQLIAEIIEKAADKPPPNLPVKEEIELHESDLEPFSEMTPEKIQGYIDNFLKLNAKQRTKEIRDLRAGIANPNVSKEYVAEMQLLLDEYERIQRIPEKIQEGESARTDRPDSREQSLQRLEKQVKVMMAETPNSAELLRIHNGSGWDTLTPHAFAERYYHLLQKDIALTEARRERSFGQKVGRFFGGLIGRRNTDDNIMSGYERNEFKQMDSIIEELGIDKSTFRSLRGAPRA